MLQLIKRDIWLNKWAALIMIGVFVPIAYKIVNMPIITLLLLVLIPLIANLFYYDSKAHILRTLISMPIAKQEIVRSRYMYSILLLIVATLYQWAAGYIIVHVFESSTFDYFVYGWQDIVVILGMGIIIISVCIPLYHTISNLYAATVVLLLLVFIAYFSMLIQLVDITGSTHEIVFNNLDQGFAMLAEKHIPFQPYVLIALGSILILYLSMKISQFLFIHRDH